MKKHFPLVTATAALALAILLLTPASGNPQQKGAPAASSAQKLSLPVLVTSCGQSPGPEQFKYFLGSKLKMDYVFKLDATAADLNAKSPAGVPIKTVIIVTGASLKGMGAAGVSIEDEINRVKGLIVAAQIQNIKVIGAHIEGMARRSQGAAPGDNSDELSIDAVCPMASLLIVKKEGDSDGRFTTISKGKGIPMISYEKNLDLENVLKDLFAK